MRKLFKPGIVTAAAFLFGSIVGAGTFALPAVAARSGLPVTFFWLAFLSAAVLLVHLMYGEIILRTPGRHRLPGYAFYYLGKLGMRWAYVGVFFSATGILLIYTVLSGQFLHELFPQHSEVLWGVLGWGILISCIFLGLRIVARAELIMSFLLVAIGLSLSLVVWRGTSFTHLGVGAGGSILLPYGALLFSLFGVHAIPEIRDVLASNIKHLGRIILLGSLGASLFYFIFITATVGAFGLKILEPNGLIESIRALSPLAALGLSLFGFFAVATSFLTIGSYVLDALQLDLGLRRYQAVLVLFLPVTLFLLGARDFLTLIAIVGTLVAVLDGVLIAVVWTRAKAVGISPVAFRVPLPSASALFPAIVFVAGAIAQLLYATNR